MNDPKKEQKEQTWADRIPDPEDQPDEYEQTYRDGSAANECWNPDREGI